MAKLLSGKHFWVNGELLNWTLIASFIHRQYTKEYTKEWGEVISVLALLTHGINPLPTHFLLHLQHDFVPS